jgi:hypothetical protein
MKPTHDQVEALAKVLHGIKYKASDWPWEAETQDTHDTFYRMARGALEWCQDHAPAPRRSRGRKGE